MTALTGHHWPVVARPAAGPSPFVSFGFSRACQAPGAQHEAQQLSASRAATSWCLRRKPVGQVVRRRCPHVRLVLGRPAVPAMRAAALASLAKK